MKIVERDVNGVCVLDLHGACTIGEADFLRDTCLEMLTRGHRLVLNFTHVTALDRAAVGVVKLIDGMVSKGTWRLVAMTRPTPPWPGAITLALHCAVSGLVTSNEEEAVAPQHYGAGTYV